MTIATDGGIELSPWSEDVSPEQAVRAGRRERPIDSPFRDEPPYVAWFAGFLPVVVERAAYAGALRAVKRTLSG
jgi:hypothetical protein